MRARKLCPVFLVFIASAWAQAGAGDLKTAAAVLDRYKQSLGGEQAIAKVHSMTVRGEAESSTSPANRRSSFTPSPSKRFSR